MNNETKNNTNITPLKISNMYNTIEKQIEFFSDTNNPDGNIGEKAKYQAINLLQVPKGQKAEYYRFKTYYEDSDQEDPLRISQEYKDIQKTNRFF